VWQEDVAVRPAGGWADLGGVVLHSTGIPVRQWNGAHLTDPAGLDRLAEVEEWFAAREMPWGLLVPTEAEQPELPLLTEQPVMLRHLGRLPGVPPYDLRWDAQHDASVVQAAAFGDPLEDTIAFVTPKTTSAACGLVTLYDGGRAVSTATLVVVDGVCAVFGVATLPEHQRRGYGRAVTLAVLHEGMRRGCDLAYLNPSPSGAPVYRGLGFTDAPGFRVYRV
jgi:ribosomal protein S18 acetylase RimI-like enzyme